MEKLPFYDRQKLSGCHSYTLSPLNVPLYSFSLRHPLKKFEKLHTTLSYYKKKKNKRKKVKNEFRL